MKRTANNKLRLELLKEVDRLDAQIKQSSKALKAINRLSS